MRRIDRETSTEELVTIAQSSVPGDTRAFRLLVERYKDRILANCRFLSGSASDSEDLAQEVFLKVYTGLTHFESRSQFPTWVQRIKINHCLSYLRRRRGWVFVDADDRGVEEMPEFQVAVSADEEATRISERDRIRLVLESMPDSLRVPLVLCDVDGLAYQEVADQLELGLSATKMRIKRAREMFRERFDRRDSGGTRTDAAASHREATEAESAGGR